MKLNRKHYYHSYYDTPFNLYSYSKPYWIRKKVALNSIKTLLKSGHFLKHQCGVYFLRVVLTTHIKIEFPSVGCYYIPLNKKNLEWLKEIMDE